MTIEELKEIKKEANRARMRKNAKKVKISILVILLLITFGRSLWGILGVNIKYSDGERIVKIIRLSNKGLVWKTWEVEGVLTQGNFAVTYIWEFSIDNQNPDKEKLLKELSSAFENGETVKIHYDQRAGSVPWRSKTPYFVRDIRVQ